MANDHDDLLDFWFGRLTDGFADSHHRRRWFEVRAEFDHELRERYGHLPGAAPEAWLASPRGRLAWVIAHDQLPRNVLRGTPGAYAWDTQALRVAADAVNAGDDAALSPDERAFLYMPFEHSERLLDQHTCVGLFTLLRDETPPGARHITGNYLRFAHQHRDIIRRFGRFPHRNAVLGRTSTPAEEAFLERGHRFGQETEG